MNKFNYGSFDTDNTDIAFSSTNGYSDPSSELDTRKQLSYPLKELKTFINNTVPVDSGDNVIQLVLDGGILKYRTAPGETPVPIGSALDIDDIYPVGSIYMSVNNTNPSTLFADTTWEQIKDTFLLSAGDTYAAGSTGGEATHTLTADEIPSHTHSYVGYSNTIAVSMGSSGSVQNSTSTATSGSAGGGQAHNNMPPYLTVYVWKRTA